MFYRYGRYVWWRRQENRDVVRRHCVQSHRKELSWDGRRRFEWVDRGVTVVLQYFWYHYYYTVCRINEIMYSCTMYTVIADQRNPVISCTCLRCVILIPICWVALYIPKGRNWKQLFFPEGLKTFCVQILVLILDLQDVNMLHYVHHKCLRYMFECWFELLPTTICTFYN